MMRGGTNPRESKKTWSWARRRIALAFGRNSCMGGSGLGNRHSSHLCRYIVRLLPERRPRPFSAGLITGALYAWPAGARTGTFCLPVGRGVSVFRLMVPFLLTILLHIVGFVRNTIHTSCWLVSLPVRKLHRRGMTRGNDAWDLPLDRTTCGFWDVLRLMKGDGLMRVSMELHPGVLFSCQSDFADKQNGGEARKYSTIPRGN